MPQTQTIPAAGQPPRRVYVDAMKGLGIILVVWGHFEEYYRGTSPLFNGTFECMYLFHMALFCLCSGLVAKFNWKKLILQQVWLYLACQTLWPPVSRGTARPGMPLPPPGCGRL